MEKSDFNVIVIVRTGDIEGELRGILIVDSNDCQVFSVKMVRNLLDFLFCFAEFEKNPLPRGGCNLSDACLVKRRQHANVEPERQVVLG